MSFKPGMEERKSD